MNIGLIDVDGHNYPNVALMKIGAYHKAHGDNVEWAMPNLFGGGMIKSTQVRYSHSLLTSKAGMIVRS